jgi:hypothetical protein
LSPTIPQAAVSWRADFPKSHLGHAQSHSSRKKAQPVLRWRRKMDRGCAIRRNRHLPAINSGD